MSWKPVIGLNADFRCVNNDAPAYSFLAAGYYDGILKAGGIPLIVPPSQQGPGGMYHFYFLQLMHE